jgi:hypothetical protein
MESLWTTLKRKYLLTQRRPKLELLVDIIINQHMAYLAKMINQHRNLEDPLKPNWYRTLRLLLIIGITVLSQNISSIAKRNGYEELLERVRMYRASTENWWCACPAYKNAGYHICKPLIILYIKEDSLKIKQTSYAFLWESLEATNGSRFVDCR